MGRETELAPAIQLDTDAEQQHRTQAVGILERAKGLRVQTPKQYEEAATTLRDVVKPAIKAIESWFSPLAEAAHRAHRAITQRRSEVLEPLVEAERALHEKMGAWAQKERERQREEERKRNEQLQIDAREREALRREALKADAPAPPPPPPPPAPVSVPSRIPEVKGVSTRTYFDYEIPDEAKLERSWLVPNHKRIESLVRSQGKQAEQLCPGLVVVERTGIASRAGKA